MKFLFLIVLSVSVFAQSKWWLANIEHRGRSPFNNNPDNFKVFRNVKDYGAKGDGATDDILAINEALDTGCQGGCYSTTSPALVYFPPGTYLVSNVIRPNYYSDLVGDPLDIPVLKVYGIFFIFYTFFIRLLQILRVIWLLMPILVGVIRIISTVKFVTLLLIPLTALWVKGF
jgi:hypothetical protein